MKRLKALGVLVLLLFLITQLHALPTLIWLTGFEYGLATPVATSGTNGMWPALTAGATVQGVTKRSGDFALKLDTSGGDAACYLQKTITGTCLVARFYVNFGLIDTTRFCLFTVNSGTDCGISKSVNQKFSAEFSSSDFEDGTVTVTTGVWYRIDVRITIVPSTSRTIDWAIDGVAQTQHTVASTATTFGYTHVGWDQAATTSTVYYDDIAYGYTTGDYPLGEGNVVGLRPTSDVTCVNAADQMELSDGTDINGTSVVAWNVLEENPWTSEPAADYVRQATGSATDYYCVINFADTAHTTINGVTALLEYASETATTNNGACEVWDSDNQITTVWGISTSLADYSEITSFYRAPIVLTPSGGWTMAHVNALVCKFGYSTDSSPDPYWLAVMLEVDYGADAAPGWTNMPASQIFIMEPEKSR